MTGDEKEKVKSEEIGYRREVRGKKKIMAKGKSKKAKVKSKEMERSIASYYHYHYH